MLFSPLNAGFIFKCQKAKKFNYKEKENECVKPKILKNLSLIHTDLINKLKPHKEILCYHPDIMIIKYM